MSDGMPHAHGLPNNAAASNVEDVEERLEGVQSRYEVPTDKDDDDDADDEDSHSGKFQDGVVDAGRGQGGQDDGNCKARKAFKGKRKGKAGEDDADNAYGRFSTASPLSRFQVQAPNQSSLSPVLAVASRPPSSIPTSPGP